MWLNDSKECSGCGACAVICRMNAICMKTAEDGFKYPSIDPERCINCGMCEDICKARKDEERNYPAKAYAAVGTDEHFVSKSASGGAFAATAREWMKRDGLVAGVIMKKNSEGFYVHHLLSNSCEDLSAMQGSKYIQSDAWECYDGVIEAVRSGRPVLFSGTPCQVSAIKRLTKNPDNLVTMDLVCHGVPSARMFNEYTKMQGKRLGGTLCDIRFRDKTCGKNFYAELCICKRWKRRAYYLSSTFMSFYKFFLRGITYRESCYDCPYANIKRVSDITVGDYWGIAEKHAHDFQEGRMKVRNDWSCVLVNTDKGKRFLDSCSDSLYLVPSRVEWVTEKNAQLNHPSTKPAERERLMRLYIAKGYEALERVFVQENGGTLRYYWRMTKNMLANQKRHMQSKGRIK